MNAGDRQHVPPAERVGDLLEVADAVGDAEHQHDEVGVDAAGPAARERQGQGLHAAMLVSGYEPSSAAMTSASEAGSRPTTVVPSAAVMIGRWIARGCSASAFSQRRGTGVLGQVDALLLGLLGAGDVPRLEAEPVQHLGQLGGGRHVVEVAAHRVLDAAPRRARRVATRHFEHAG